MNCQDHLYRNQDPKHVSRRWFIEQCGVGLGAMAFGHLLQNPGFAAALQDAPLNPLAPKKPHHTAKAKSIIYLFMAGAPSHLELFDFKPQLAKFDGTLPPPELLKGYRAALSIPTPSCWVPSSSSPSMARAALNFLSCYLTSRPWLTTLPS